MCFGCFAQEDILSLRKSSDWMKNKSHQVQAVSFLLFLTYFTVFKFLTFMEPEGEDTDMFDLLFYWDHLSAWSLKHGDQYIVLQSCCALKSSPIA